MEEVEVDPTQTAALDQPTTMTDATTEKISTSASMNVAKSQASKAQSNLKSVSAASIMPFWSLSRDCKTVKPSVVRVPNNSE